MSPCTTAAWWIWGICTRFWNYKVLTKCVLDVSIYFIWTLFVVSHQSSRFSSWKLTLINFNHQILMLASATDPRRHFPVTRETNSICIDNLETQKRMLHIIPLIFFFLRGFKKIRFSWKYRENLMLLKQSSPHQYVTLFRNQIKILEM